MHIWSDIPHDIPHNIPHNIPIEQQQPRLIKALLHPVQALSNYEHQSGGWWALWSKLSLIAIGGSLIYGASIAMVSDGWQLGRGALWLTLSAGLSWIIFMPILAWSLKLRLGAILQACLITMAYGEMVLVGGAMINLIIKYLYYDVDVLVVNLTIIGISNLVMMTALAKQLKVLNISWQHTIKLWLLVLNGSGAIFFMIFKKLLLEVI